MLILYLMNAPFSSVLTTSEQMCPYITTEDTEIVVDDSDAVAKSGLFGWGKMSDEVSGLYRYLDDDPFKTILERQHLAELEGRVPSMNCVGVWKRREPADPSCYLLVIDGESSESFFKPQRLMITTSTSIIGRRASYDYHDHQTKFDSVGCRPDRPSPKFNVVEQSPDLPQIHAISSARDLVQADEDQKDEQNLDIIVPAKEHQESQTNANSEIDDKTESMNTMDCDSKSDVKKMSQQITELQQSLAVIKEERDRLINELKLNNKRVDVPIRRMRG